MIDMIEQFHAARRTRTPLLAIRTADPINTQYEIGAHPSYEKLPIVCWDAVNGLAGINELGIAAVAQALGGKDPAESTFHCSALSMCTALPPDTIAFFHHLQLFLDLNDSARATIIHAIGNLREPFKSNRRTLVLLGPDFKLPAEINQDVVMFDEPLPTDAQLKTIVTDTYKASKLDEPTEEVLDKAVDALRGLASFPAEQVTAMSLTKEGLNLETLWERKYQMIEQIQGLSIWRGKETFDDVRGYDNVENYLKMIFGGEEPPKAILFIDEVEKHIAGATGGDLSGVKQDMLGALLTWMQDHRAAGIIFIGVAGGGKSAIAKAAGNYANIPTISMDLGGMQDSLVGKTGQNVRAALRVADAISSGQILIIATCNRLQALPPELRRRFTLGTFFFDLPNKEGKAKIWELYLKKYNLINGGGKKELKLPDDDGWTGAEIEKCCHLAYKVRSKPVDVASFIVPVSKSAPEELEALRNMAHNTFVSASEGGVFRHEKQAQKKPPTSGRAVNLNN